MLLGLPMTCNQSSVKFWMFEQYSMKSEPQDACHALTKIIFLIK